MMVELGQLNIHSSRDIIARHGLTLPELFQLSLEFYKEEKHQFNLSYEQKNQLAAYWRQCMLGPYHPEKLNPGYFDFVGNDRKKAWEALGEISSNGAMAGFCNLLETVCPDLVPWIRHKKREKENKLKEEKARVAAIKKQEEEEELEARKLINIVKKAEDLKVQSVEKDSSEDEEMPTLEKNDRKLDAFSPPVSATQSTLTPDSEPDKPAALVEPTVCPQLKLPEQAAESDLIQCCNPAESSAVKTTPAVASNCTDSPSSDAATAAAATPTDLNTILTQHFACVLYLKQMREAGHTLTAEQNSYLEQMAAYEDQLNSLKTRIEGSGTVTNSNVTVTKSNGTVTEPINLADTEVDEAPTDTITSQESFALVNKSDESLEMIKPTEIIKSVDGTVETRRRDANTNGDLGPNAQELIPAANTQGLGVPANAEEVSALAETLQKQLADDPTTTTTSHSENSDYDSDSEVRLWSKTGVDIFVGEVSKDPDSILNVGRGETVTVRIPTYESGSALYWEFATEHYDIGFGASFEWEEEEEEGRVTVRREPILPILRRSSQEKVITGSHAYPRSGTYLLLFDNSYSLLRSKTVYYRVFYTR